MSLVDHIAAVVLVRSERDGWDWFLFGLSVIAALSAVIALWTWWTRLRRVPEVAFGWEKPDGTAWPPGEHITLRRGTATRFRVVLNNVGAASASLVVINVIVPKFLELSSTDRDDKPRFVHASGDVAVNCPPDDAVWFVAAHTAEFVPGIALIVPFSVKVPVDLPDHLPESFFFAVSAESERFTRSGHMRIPSFGVAANPEFWTNRTWPGRTYPWWPPRQIRTQPRRSVRAGPGRRIDRRPVDIADV
jgi:hypothetical protein